MERSELLQVLSPEGLRLLDSLPPYSSQADVVRMVSDLRKAGHAPALVAAVLSQAKLRARAAGKFGEFASRLLYTEAGLEQATRLAVAAVHAGRFRSAGMESVGDLGCGIGADALALSAIGVRVIAVERDEVTAAIASYNLAAFETATVELGDAESFDTARVDAVYLDPARRSSGHSNTTRISDPADYSPTLHYAFDLANSVPTGIKLGPGFDRDLIPEGLEAQWVSVDGSVVEMGLWSGLLARADVGRAALVIDQDGHHEMTAPADTDDVAVAPLGEWLYEPDGAVIRARLIGQLADDLGAGMISDGIAWMTGDSLVATPFASAFRIDEVLPLDIGTLRKRLRTLGIGTLEVKKRGVDIDPATFRTKLSLKGPESATLILTRVGGKRQAILAQRAPSTA